MTLFSKFSSMRPCIGSVHVEHPTVIKLCMGLFLLVRLLGNAFPAFLSPTFYLRSSLLAMSFLMSTGPAAASAFAFSSCSFCQVMMGLMLGLRFLVFCCSWASLRGTTKITLLWWHVIYISQITCEEFEIKTLTFLTKWTSTLTKM